jgi:hypothetical protein
MKGLTSTKKAHCWVNSVKSYSVFMKIPVKLHYEQSWVSCWEFLDLHLTWFKDKGFNVLCTKFRSNITIPWQVIQNFRGVSFSVWQTVDSQKRPLFKLIFCLLKLISFYESQPLWVLGWFKFFSKTHRANTRFLASF